jgi:hypothetical protein
MSYRHIDVDIEYKVVPFTRDRRAPALELYPLLTASEVGERDSRSLEEESSRRS